ERRAVGTRPVPDPPYPVQTRDQPGGLEPLRLVVAIERGSLDEREDGYDDAVRLGKRRTVECRERRHDLGDGAGQEGGELVLPRAALRIALLDSQDHVSAAQQRVLVTALERLARWERREPPALRDTVRIRKYGAWSFGHDAERDSSRGAVHGRGARP